MFSELDVNCMLVLVAARGQIVGTSHEVWLVLDVQGQVVRTVREVYVRALLLHAGQGFSSFPGLAPSSPNGTHVRVVRNTGCAFWLWLVWMVAWRLAAVAGWWLRNKWEPGLGCQGFWNFRGLAPRRRKSLEHMCTTCEKHDALFGCSLTG